MRKLFISQPMRGLTEEEICKNRALARFYAEDTFREKFEVLETYFDFPDGTKPLEYLGESIKYLSKADVVVFAHGWDKARGCKIEQICATEYGVTCIYQ